MWTADVSPKEVKREEKDTFLEVRRIISSNLRQADFRHKNINTTVASRKREPLPMTN